MSARAGRLAVGGAWGWMVKLSRKPHRVHPHRNHGDEAWWYENAKSIDVYIRDSRIPTTLAVRIPRKTLKAWLEKTKDSNDNPNPR